MVVKCPPPEKNACMLSGTRVCLSVTSGVDINHAAEHEHAMGVLQFVAGLGPRKAAKLRERLGTVLSGVVPSRKSLLSSQLLKSLVYTNAAGFLRVRERGK